ncbi:MAG: FimV/HubP family polar landmark protein, partial [Gallionellaceae bacterium]
ITVKRGDTLSKIAARNKLDGVSLDRMLVALYQANVDQFDDGNMNRIRAGKQLRLPDQDELMLISQTDAENKIRVQTIDWNAYRQKLASAATTGRQQADSQQVVSGKITSSVEDKTVAAKSVAKEVLKLSKGSAVGDQVATGVSLSAEEKNNAAQEELIAGDKAVKDGQSRAALLAKNLQDMKELAQLKSDVAALAKLENAKSAPVPAPVAKVAPTPVSQPDPVVESEEGSSNMLYFAGGAALLLGLAGWFLWNRRRRDDVESAFEAEEIIAETAVAPTAETPDFANTIVSDTPVVAATEESGDVDPIAEADLFLSFGRDAQAEEILKQALLSAPQN